MPDAEPSQKPLAISRLMLGGNVFGWTADEPTSFQILDAFLDSGLNSIDTADVYSRWATGQKGGESETVLGKWFQRSKKRDKALIATKVGMEMGESEKGLKRGYILQAVERSLKRLQTDWIDLYQSHTDDPETPLDETLSAYDLLIKQGKVRHVGASNYSAERLNEAMRTSREQNLPRYESLQPLYNLYDRADFETKLAPVCREHRIAVIPYFSLAAGFLTGKYRSADDLKQSARAKTVEKYLNPRGMRILAALDEVAKNLRAKPGQIALAWLMAQPVVTAPIASATNLDQLRDLVESTRLKLDDASLKLLDEASRE